VRLRKYIVTEERTITVQLRHEEFRLEQEPITDPGAGTAASGGPGEVDTRPGTGDDQAVTMVLYAERPVISTEVVPVERIRVSKYVVSDEQTVSAATRREWWSSSGTLLSRPLVLSSTERGDCHDHHWSTVADRRRDRRAGHCVEEHLPSPRRGVVRPKPGHHGARVFFLAGIIVGAVLMLGIALILGGIRRKGSRALQRRRHPERAEDPRDDRPRDNVARTGTGQAGSTEQSRFPDESGDRR